jgi:hypothetical protein
MSVPAKPNAKVSTFGGLRLVPRTVIALGLVSLCMDTSSEIIHSLLPAFLVTVLGANGLSIGIIEGVAEAMTAISRIFSGALSDWLGKTKAPGPDRLWARSRHQTAVSPRHRYRDGIHRPFC